jgi:hypothetical protein
MVVMVLDKEKKQEESEEEEKKKHIIWSCDTFEPCNPVLSNGATN